MTISRVQDAFDSHSSAGNPTVSVTLPGATGIGNILIGVWKDNNNASTVTMPAGWTQIGNSPYFAGTGMELIIGYKVVAATNESTVVFTCSDDATNKSLYVVEVSGIDSPFTGITTPNNAAVTSRQLTSTGVLANPDSYIIAVVSQSSANGGGSSVDSGFTVRQEFSNNIVVDKITAVATALAPTVSWNTARGAFGLMAIFPMTSAPPAVGPDVYVYDGATWVAHTLDKI